MDRPMLIQLAGSIVAVIALVALAAWAKIARPMVRLDADRARDLLGEEFPGKPLDDLWVATDGRSALARSGAWALILSEVGDGYVARHIAWDQALAASYRDGVLQVSIARREAARPKRINVQ